MRFIFILLALVFSQAMSDTVDLGKTYGKLVLEFTEYNETIQEMGEFTESGRYNSERAAYVASELPKFMRRFNYCYKAFRQYANNDERTYKRTLDAVIQKYVCADRMGEPFYFVSPDNGDDIMRLQCR